MTLEISLTHYNPIIIKFKNDMHQSTWGPLGWWGGEGRLSDGADGCAGTEVGKGWDWRVSPVTPPLPYEAGTDGAGAPLPYDAAIWAPTWTRPEKYKKLQKQKRKNKITSLIEKKDCQPSQAPWLRT